MISTLQTNSSKKHFKAGDNCCFNVYFFKYYICSAVPQFNIRSSSAADYKHIDVLFTFSAKKKFQVISSKR